VVCKLSGAEGGGKRGYKRLLHRRITLVVRDLHKAVEHAVDVVCAEDEAWSGRRTDRSTSFAQICRQVANQILHNSADVAGRKLYLCLSQDIIDALNNLPRVLQDLCQLSGLEGEAETGNRAHMLLIRDRGERH
jgi:hypothetical protein